MQCEHITTDPMAYFTKGDRRLVRCDRKAKWVVSVNPPNATSDGKKRLCDLCNGGSYIGFTREPLPPE